MTNILSSVSTVAMYRSYYDEPDIGSLLIPYLLPLIVAIVLYFAACGLIVDAAVQKGHERNHLFAICFWLGIPGMIYVASLPDLKLRDMLRSNNTSYNTESLKTQDIDENVLEGKWKCGTCGKVNSGNVCNCGTWKCPKCGKSHSSYVGTCSCGAQKPRT